MVAILGVIMILIACKAPDMGGAGLWITADDANDPSSKNSHFDNKVKDDKEETQRVGTLSSTASEPASRKAPYGEFCETRPRGEKEEWNMRKKIISYSLFLPDDQKGQEIPEYLLGGLVANIRLSQLYYPEWIIRVYVLNLSDQQIQDVLRLDDKRLEVVKCHDDSPLNQLGNARKMYTRFLVVDDPTVEYGMIRDLDSRLSIRELLAVNEWISSGLGFHTLRDHSAHVIAIMGCSWGAKRGTINVTATVKQALQDYPNSEVPGCCADDQNFLSKFIWNAVKDNAMDHDMDAGRCHNYGAKVCRKYPIGPRHDEKIFIGHPLKDGNVQPPAISPMMSGTLTC
jgi:hypothetical protein